MELESRVFTRRQYLTYEAIVSGATIWDAIEAVASTAIEHPEWQMDEELTWAEWMRGGTEDRAAAEPT